jgi:hypothetical protein
MATLHQSGAKKLKTRDAKHQPEIDMKKSRDSRTVFFVCAILLDCRFYPHTGGELNDEERQ